MKNQIKLILALLVMILVGQSCSSDPCGNNKDAFLDKFEVLVDKIEGIDYDTEDKNWEKYNEEFEHMIKECYKIHEDDLSSREERRLWKKTTAYYVRTFTGNGDLEKQAAEFGRLIEENVGDVSDKLSKAIDGIDINIDFDEAEIEALLEELGGDIEKMGDKWGKKLEKLLEKE